MFPGGPPSDAGLVLVQVKESDQSFLLPLQFGHLSATLHGAHAPLHYMRAQGDVLIYQGSNGSPCLLVKLVSNPLG